MIVQAAYRVSIPGIKEYRTIPLYRHSDMGKIFAAFGYQPGECKIVEQGFVDSRGNFYNRKAALQEALRCDPEEFSSKSLEQILSESLTAYLDMITDRNMIRFFRVLYSERSINPLAAEIMLEETEHMIRSTRNLFYALAVHGKMKNEGVDTAAMTFAMTVHSLVDYRLDKITAGKAAQFGDCESPFTKEMTEFIRWFSIQIGGKSHEQKTH